MSRDDLIWAMAERAWAHYYCPEGASGVFCEHCQQYMSSAGVVECGELQGGFDKERADEWRSAAEGALLALEASLGIKVAD